MSENRVIGIGNKIPWHLPKDFKWFKSLTIGQAVVMGRKTFESIGSKPLPGRKNFVLSRTSSIQEGIRFVSSKELLEIAHGPGYSNTTFFICGGQNVYEQFLSKCSMLYLTIVKRFIQNGEVFFPPFEDQFSLPVLMEENEDFKILSYTNLKL